jgi:aminopeptidase N
LKSHQFPEDSGPLAHPVRPEIYSEINNFYTATVYEKGAEVIRVLKILLGPMVFKQGMDLYLSRHDGDAATIEDFVACFAEVSGRDLSQFFLWYRQSGTPEIAVEVRHDARAGTVTLDVTQTLYPTPGQPSKQPMVIPIAFGLVGEDGRDRPLLSEDGQLSGGILEINALKHRFVFSGHPTRPIASLNRGFSAPVKISANLSDQDLLFLAGHDNDPYNRWQSAQTVATRLLTQSTTRVRDGLAPLDSPSFIAALEAGLDIVSGMHSSIDDIPELKDAVLRTGRRFIEVRRPPANIRVGTGQKRTGKRLLTVGTDCALGKKYTALAIARAFAARGVDCDFRATGQTGVFISGRGVAIDAVVADFIAGMTDRFASSEHQRLTGQRLLA